MALVARTVTIGDDWTLVTSNVAAIQFNDEMFATVTFGGTPEDVAGFTYQEGEMYVNGAADMYVWAKKKVGGTNVESVRVLEEIV